MHKNRMNRTRHIVVRVNERVFEPCPCQGFGTLGSASTFLEPPIGEEALKKRNLTTLCKHLFDVFRRIQCTRTGSSAYLRPRKVIENREVTFWYPTFP